MGEFHAWFIEDEDSAVVGRIESVLEGAGFDTTRTRSAEETRRNIADDSASVPDLIVIDRKLPEAVGGPPNEAVGDGLFEVIEQSFRDARIFVLTGFSDEASVRNALQRPNALDIGRGGEVQRVVHYSKAETLEFARAVVEYGRALVETDNVAVQGLATDSPNRRVLKRVGQHFGGSRVSVRPAAGGVSDAQVWLCDVFTSDGRLATSVVVKIIEFGATRPYGGFMDALPAYHSAKPSDVLQGACAGLAGVVAPLAGKGAISLSNLLTADIEQGSDVFRELVQLLRTVPRATRTIGLGLFMAPLVEAEVAQEVADRNGILLPRADLPVRASYGALHGDLHPGNVLLVEGRPVFIDFDRQRLGALALDVVSLGFGSVFHPAGPLRDTPEVLTEVLDGFDDMDFAVERFAGEIIAACDPDEFDFRERWAALLAYGLRQLKYPDVVGNADLSALAVRMCTLASAALRGS